MYYRPFAHHHNDDSAPLDYQSASSSAEVERRIQSRSIHPEEELVNVGQSPAMPQAILHDRYATPSEEPEKKRSRSRSRRNANPAPVEETIPDDRPEWMRVAQQNSLPDGLRSELRKDTTVYGQPQERMKPDEPTEVPRYDPLGRPIRGVTVNKPKQEVPPEEPYVQAGYPDHLVQAHKQQQRQQEAWQKRTAHGAKSVAQRQEAKQQRAPAQWRPVQHGQTMYRQNAPTQGQHPIQPQYQQHPHYQQQPHYPTQPYQQPPEPKKSFFSFLERKKDQPSTPYPTKEPELMESQEAEQEQTWLSRMPWLGIITFSVIFLAIGLWLWQLDGAQDLTEALAEQASEIQYIADQHPYEYRDIIEAQADINNLHPAFVAAIVMNESSFRTNATSSVDARGLMQVMNNTASWIYDQRGDTYGFDFDRLYEAELNVTYGCWYLNYLSNLFRGDPILVAAAYHAGQNEVQNWLNDSRYSDDQLTIELDNMIDGPTKQYATRVLEDYSVYKRLYYETTEVS